MQHNPSYDRLAPKWEFARDAYEGTEAVKRGRRALDYLPMTKQELAETREFGVSRHYEIRRASASYENFFRPIVDDVAGFMQKNPPTIKFGAVSDGESPAEIRAICWYGNRYNDGLAGLKQRLNFAQVLEGRYGLLLDLICGADGRDAQFSISEYRADAILDGEPAPFRPTRRAAPNGFCSTSQPARSTARQKRGSGSPGTAFWDSTRTANSTRPCSTARRTTNGRRST